MDGERYIEKIKITNLLSFGPAAEEIELQPLNVLIGPNGSGKSNFLETLVLLRQIPGNLARHFQIRGGPAQWIYRGRGAAVSVASTRTSGSMCPSETKGRSLRFNSKDLEAF